MTAPTLPLPEVSDSRTPVAGPPPACSTRPEQRATRPIDAVVFDAEIARCIPDRGKPRDPTLEYCDGWTDYRGMGVAVVCAFDTRTRSPRVFLADNLDAFRQLVAGRVVLGFNSHAFDAPLLAAHGVRFEGLVAGHYDLRLEVYDAAGVGHRTRGYKLDELSRANFGAGKPMSGSLAPVLWQRGERGAVVDYCLDDTMRTARLAQLATIIDPTNGRALALRPVSSAAGVS